jgi:cyclopropane fatty-acyl-phospholipid synthase-like methyltransferase
MNAKTIRRLWKNLRFRGSAAYWERRYSRGRTSGSGSQDRLAEFKAEVLNRFVADNDIGSVIEFGCGDGNQLALARYPRYIGLDVSRKAIELCTERFGSDPSKTFVHHEPDSFRRRDELSADLALSLDVVYHLVEDDVFEKYMEHLFGAARRYVVVYSSNHDEPSESRSAFGIHVRHRRFVDYAERNFASWRMVEEIPNRHPFDPEDPRPTSFANFYVFERIAE